MHTYQGNLTQFRKKGIHTHIHTYIHACIHTAGGSAHHTSESDSKLSSEMAGTSQRKPATNTQSLSLSQGDKLLDHGDTCAYDMAKIGAGNFDAVSSHVHDKHSDYVDAENGTRGVVDRGVGKAAEPHGRIGVSGRGGASEADARASVDSMC